VTLLLFILVKNDDQEKHSFVASVGLETFILWNGKIKARWKKAKALRQVGNGYSALSAQGYKLQLRYLGGNEILQEKNVTFSGDATSSCEFAGIDMEMSYQVDIVCIFEQEKVFHCGKSILFSSSPLLVVHKSETRTSVYAETVNPDQWSNLEAFCDASNGHLVSLTDMKIEKEIAKRSTLSNFWTGGNICQDSPAPKNSLWVSGLTNIQFTNFATDSELDGNHCCIKVDLNDAKNGSQNGTLSKWKGESCESILKGVCEFHIQGKTLCFVLKTKA
jgi:hypothetical protein